MRDRIFFLALCIGEADASSKRRARRFEVQRAGWLISRRVRHGKHSRHDAGGRLALDCTLRQCASVWRRRGVPLAHTGVAHLVSDPYLILI